MNLNIFKCVYTEHVGTIPYTQRDGRWWEPFGRAFPIPSVQHPQEMADVCRVKARDEYPAELNNWVEP